MKIALLMNDNSYAGREYIKALSQARILFDIIIIGKYPEVNITEKERCGGYWKPEPFAILSKGINSFHFQSLSDEELGKFLAEQKYDLGIQGGTGIIKQNIIDKFELGILNFHPGDLPLYRGASAPEWQIVEGRFVVCTCHLVSKGIDEGDIYRKRVLELDYSDYYKMRAGIYPRTAEFVKDVVKEIVGTRGFVHKPTKQDQDKAKYRKYIGDEGIAYIKKNFKELVSKLKRYEVL